MSRFPSRFFAGPVIPFPKAKAAGPWFEFKNASEQSVDVYIYDAIGDYYTGTDASSFVKQLQTIKAAKINLHINSPGGSVFDGVAIYNALRAHSAEVTTHIDGLAASIASVIALAGDKVLIAENAMIMIHNPSAFVFGESDYLRKQADVLDQIAETLITTYASKTGEDREAIKAAMAAETWYTAKEAIAAKLADEVTAPLQAVACSSAEELRALGYSKVPQVIAEAPSPISPTTPRALLQRRQAFREKYNH
jgi:ATP-dependent Clp endopeptidase proteolytic subunit ClpP